MSLVGYLSPLEPGARHGADNRADQADRGERVRGQAGSTLNEGLPNDTDNRTNEVAGGFSTQRHLGAESEAAGVAQERPGFAIADLADFADLAARQEVKP